ncbi:MAG: efflux RND transporter periplasmic adaptor subunit, partial [Lachnospiraceae bacterium]|nr:efflux RND transporter periplasmic adaptor subunit [Lachnospiraceae bacterium]
MNKPKKREVIKNIAIVFLVIMLILTFFSNTIMNRTLPEVNTQSVTSGPVTTQVRGDGVVEAEDPYNVVCDETRKIKSVVKHVGDHVDIDDVLFLLEGETSEELTTAKNDLETAKSDYDLEILNSGLTQAEIASVEAGVTATTSSILASLESKDNEINSLKSQDEDYTKKIADIDKQLELMGYTPVDTNTEAEAKAVEDAQNALNAAIETRDAYLNAQKAVESKINAQTAYEDSKKAYDEADEKLKVAQSDFDKADYDYTVAKNDYYSKNDIFNA